MIEVDHSWIVVSDRRGREGCTVYMCTVCMCEGRRKVRLGGGGGGESERKRERER